MNVPAPLRRARDAVRLLAGRWRVERALAGAQGEAATLLRAVRTAVRGTATAEEAAWMRRIEALRARLLASDRPLTLVDYGAGDPGMTLTAEAMHAGRTVTRTVAQVCGGSKAQSWARVLFHLVRARAPRSCVELGTNLGISAAYQSAALALNGAGTLATLEGAAPVAELARGHLSELELDGIATVVTGRFQDTLEDVLRERAPVDYVFVDGHHDEQATLRYFEQVHPHLAPAALLVFDDVAWSAGMRRAWSALRADPRIRVALDLGSVGICLTGPEERPRVDLRVPIG